jgi:hypothetical protein
VGLFDSLVLQNRAIMVLSKVSENITLSSRQFRQLNGGLQTQATVSASDKCNSLIRSAH